MCETKKGMRILMILVTKQMLLSLLIYYKLGCYSFLNEHEIKIMLVKMSFTIR